jgi:hypothetical protein
MGKMKTRIRLHRSTFLVPLLLGALSFTLHGCCFHDDDNWDDAETPRVDEVKEPSTFGVNVRLTFDGTWALYREVINSRNEESVEQLSDESINALSDDTHQRRYIVLAYPANTLSDPERFVFTKSSDGSWNSTLEVKLEEGDYDFYVWADYVDVGSEEDKYQTTSDFEQIALMMPYSGTDEFRDAFRGFKKGVSIADGTELAELQTVDISMERPLARFRVITTDVDEFANTVLGNLGAGDLDGYNSSYEYVAALLKNYTIRFYYTGFVPSVYDLFSDAPVDSRTDLYFDGVITRISDSEAEIGFDYVFVGSLPTSVSLAMGVYDRNGDLITMSSSMDVPLQRGGITVVTGKFLSSQSGSGATINPQFSGDYNLKY